MERASILTLVAVWSPIFAYAAKVGVAAVGGDKKCKQQPASSKQQPAGGRGQAGKRAGGQAGKRAGVGPDQDSRATYPMKEKPCQSRVFGMFEHLDGGRWKTQAQRVKGQGLSNYRVLQALPARRP